MTKSDKEWQRVTKNDKEWQRMTKNDKEWQICHSSADKAKTKKYISHHLGFI